MTECIQDLYIDQFRGIKNLRLENLGHINIIAGINNCGKTSVLEAIKILQSPVELQNLVRLSMNRGDPRNFKKVIQMVASLYYQSNDDPPSFRIELRTNNVLHSLESTVDQSERLELAAYDYASENTKKTYLLQDTLHIASKYKSSVDPRPIYLDFEITEESIKKMEFISNQNLFSCVFLNTTASLYVSCKSLIKQSILGNRKSEFIKTLRYFDNNINDISIVEDDIYIHTRNKPAMPLYTYGAGTQKSLLLIALLYRAKDGVLLIDEIDAGIHLSAYNEVFLSFLKMSKQLNVQLFLSTHSIECIDSILNCVKSLSIEDETRVITLKKSNNETLSRILDGADALLSRENYRIELRQ